MYLQGNAVHSFNLTLRILQCVLQVMQTVGAGQFTPVSLDLSTYSKVDAITIVLVAKDATRPILVKDVSLTTCQHTGMYS